MKSPRELKINEEKVNKQLGAAVLMIAKIDKVFEKYDEIIKSEKIIDETAIKSIIPIEVLNLIDKKIVEKEIERLEQHLKMIEADDFPTRRYSICVLIPANPKPKNSSCFTSCF